MTETKATNATYLGYIQNAITRMGQNSFHAKTWCITLLAALLVFFLGQTDAATRCCSLAISCAVTVLFCLLDTYYLYLERGYRHLYKLAANLLPDNSEVIQEYEMSIPQSQRGFRKYVDSLISVTTGLFYLIVLVLQIALIICAVKGVC